MTSISQTPAPRATFTVRSAEDLLAVAPIVLGFEPTESLVLLTFGSGDTFHARVDLPAPEHVDEVVGLLVEPVLVHRPSTAAVLCYSADEVLARRAATRLAAALRAEEVHVIDVLRAHEGRWFPLRGRSRAPAHGVAYDAATHPFRVESVVSGRVVHGSREELRNTLRRDPGQQAAIAALIESPSGAGGCSPQEAGCQVDRHLEGGRFPDDVLARLLVGLREVPVRDAVWSPMTRHRAPDHVRLWADAVRRAPDRDGAAPAAVLAVAAWLAGHGALAWCAVDRCQELQPGNTLAALVADLLSDAVPPRMWDAAFPPGDP